MMALAAGTDTIILEKAGFFDTFIKNNDVLISPKKTQVIAEMLPTKASFGQQLKHLLIRETRQTYRDKGALIGRFGVTIFLNTLIGLIFSDVGIRDSAHPNGLSSHFGALVMV